MEDKIRLLYISNEKDPDYWKLARKGSKRQDPIPPLYNQRTAMLGIGKSELHKFYFKYLKFKPDIIVGTWVPAIFIPLLLKKIGLVKCPIVHIWSDYYSESMTNYPYFVVRFMEKFSAKNPDYIITVLKTIKDNCEKLNKTVFFLPFGITPGNKKTKINIDKLKTKKNNLNIIYLGDLASEYKRVDRIIEAAKGVDCDLFLFGNEVLPKLKEIAEDHKNIHFMGWVNSEEVQSVLKQGDILVNTANHDICMKFLDYIRAGKPILALNDRPGNFFKHKETAYLTDDFKKGLLDLINDKSLRKKLSKNIKSINLYSWEQVADIHVEIYKRIVNGGDLTGFKTNYYHIPAG